MPPVRSIITALVLFLFTAPSASAIVVNEGSAVSGITGYYASTPIMGMHGCSGYVFTINWGDGSVPTTGIIHQNLAFNAPTTCSGTITVPATAGTPISHVYEEAGTYTITGTGGAPIQVQVAHPELQVTAKPASIVLGAATPSVVASFTSSWKDEPASHFTALIHWGDGTPSAPATVVARGAGTFDVIAPAHTYASVGTYNAVAEIVQGIGHRYVIVAMTVVQPPAAVQQDKGSPALTVPTGPAAPVGEAAGAADRTAPVLARVKTLLKKYGVGKRATFERIVSLTSTEAGSGKVTFARKVGRRWVALPAVSGIEVVSGSNTIRFSPKVRAKLAARGAYRASITVQDAAGNATAAQVVAFTVR